ncbi:DEAD/DEAH box helicase [Pseudomonas savastanoi pv. glycinea]|nr:DEAD/DEAH box helicase [Pseudomonas savastanoi pv. glycinea]
MEALAPWPPSRNGVKAHMIRQLSTLSILAIFAGCTSVADKPAGPTVDTSQNPEQLSPDLYSNGAKPGQEPMVRYGRYALVNTAPEAEQRDLMAQIIDVSIPPNMHPSVQDAMQYVLSRSGYALCPPTTDHVNILFTRPLSSAQYKLGPMSLRNTLQVLAGPAWQVKVNEVMGVLAAKARKTVLLTGTLMGGYADDLFYLLFRILTRRMIEDGYQPNARGSMAPAAMSFMRDHGVLKDIYTERDGSSHKTAKGKKLSVRTVKAPGFGPKGIHRFVLPFTVFLKLKDIGGNVLPGYREEFIDVPMSPDQEAAHRKLAQTLTVELRQALARRDTTLLGVVLNVLLAWPDCCFRPEVVKHPRSRDTLAFVPSVFDDDELMPKEQALLDLCLAEKARNRKVLAYSVYTGTRDTTSRMKRVLEQSGLKVAVLRASVDTARREDWILDQVDRGVDVLITNPELVKTGLDLLDFPTIAFMQTGYNVYTVQQAARRSWRIGQKQDVRVIFFGYIGSSQITCLQLMAKKIAVSQSTSGDVPESGLDSLNQDGDSVEMALARQLINA